MPEPDRTQIRRRLALVAGVVALIVVAALLLADRFDQEAPPEPERPTPLVVDTKPLPLPQPPLSRAQLIEIAARAASAAAVGKPAPPEDASLVGRSFRIAIPFGCEGPSQAAAGASWSLDDARGTIRLVARPQIWTDEAWVHELAGDPELEAVEGFWLPRPWLLTGDCPASPGQTTAPPAEELGLATFFDANSSRLLQRGERPYEHVMNAPVGNTPTGAGFRLVLAGRITGYVDKTPVHCRVADRNRRPVCLFAVAFDRVAFEDPAGGAVLAEWRFN